MELVTSCNGDDVVGAVFSWLPRDLDQVARVGLYVSRPHGEGDICSMMVIWCMCEFTRILFMFVCLCVCRFYSGL